MDTLGARVPTCVDTLGAGVPPCKDTLGVGVPTCVDTLGFGVPTCVDTLEAGEPTYLRGQTGSWRGLEYLSLQVKWPDSATSRTPEVPDRQYPLTALYLRSRQYFVQGIFDHIF